MCIRDRQDQLILNLLSLFPVFHGSDLCLLLLAEFDLGDRLGISERATKSELTAIFIKVTNTTLKDGLASLDLVLLSGALLAVDGLIVDEQMLTVLLELAEDVAHLGQQLIDLPDRAETLNVITLASEVVSGLLLNLVLLLRGVGLVALTTWVGEDVVHGEFLLEIPNLLLVSLDEQLTISALIDTGRVLNLLHAGCKAQG